MAINTLTSALNSSLLAILLVTAGDAAAQMPVDDNGEPLVAEREVTRVYDSEPSNAAIDAGTDLKTYTSEAPAAADEHFTAAELESLVGPIALYPDDLLAIVLPASTYPLEIVQAARFLDAHEKDNSLQPSDEWDESVVALLNYPEVLRMLDDDIDWTWQLGDAVLSQQADVIKAVEAFRDRAYAAGNLKTDDRQRVTVNEDSDIIEIVPIEDDVIYVPYYEPSYVVQRQVVPVYYYYDTPRPVYYYPYPSGYLFASDYFWGVTTAFRIGWSSHYLHVHHPSYWGHPYYGRHYYGHHYYRRPSISVYNTTYVNNTSYVNTRVHNDRRHRDGDRWQPRRGSGARQSYYQQREARLRGDGHALDYRQSVNTVNGAASSGNRDASDRRGASGRTTMPREDRRRGVVGATFQPGSDSTRADVAANSGRNGNVASREASERGGSNRRNSSAGNNRSAESANDIRFRDRPSRPDVSTRDTATRDATRDRNTERGGARPEVAPREATPRIERDRARSDGNENTAGRSDRRDPSLRAAAGGGRERNSGADSASIRESLQRASAERQSQQGRDAARSRQAAGREPAAEVSRERVARNPIPTTQPAERRRASQAADVTREQVRRAPQAAVATRRAETASSPRQQQRSAATPVQRTQPRQQATPQRSQPRQQAPAPQRQQRAEQPARTERQAPQQSRQSTRTESPRQSNRRPRDKD